MTTDSETILKQLAALTADLTVVRATLEIQFKRMAAMQAELDLLPTARDRRRGAMQPPARNGNGNGHDHGQ
jgi:hypothetical protein